PVSYSAEAAAPALRLERFEDVIALADERRDLPVKAALERHVRLLRLEDGRLEIAPEPGAARTLVNDLSRKLAAWTGRRWMLPVSAAEGAPPVRPQIEVPKPLMLQVVRGGP